MEQNSNRQGRMEILKKIDEYEKQGKFNDDVETDPPSKELKPDDVDYLKTVPINRIKNWISHLIVYNYNKEMKRKHSMKVEGIENLQNIKSGAVITSNHFSISENLSVMNAMKHTPSKHKLYRVIKEGNMYVPGIIGFCLRNDDTLPLSSNKRTMIRFINAVDIILQQGDFVLFYPERSMWWNYKKPRPYENGAFHFAAKNNVPVIPCFTTMKDSNRLDENGFPIQKYTTHIMKPIYPDALLSITENIEIMKKKNYEMCVQKYEEVYGKKMEYLKEKEKTI